MTNDRPILVVPGSPRSIFYEIFFKALKEKKFKNPIIIIGNKEDLLNSSKKKCPEFKIILKKIFFISNNYNWIFKFFFF